LAPLVILPGLLAADAREPLILQLDSLTRARLVLILAVLLLLGLSLMLLTWLGGRVARRYAGWRKPLPGTRQGAPSDEEDWCNKPLVNTDQRREPGPAP
jgi:hypothetical protein